MRPGTGQPPDPAGVGEARPRLVSPGLVRVFVASFGAMTSFYLLLSVVPLYATSGEAAAGEAGAGFATGALLLSTVAAELVTPWLAARFGYRAMFGAGLLLLGAPALALAGSAQLAAILAVCVVRGLGFGVVVVLGGASVAALVPPERRGEGLGLYGMVVGVPSVLALPLGVFLVGRVGYPAVFVAGAAAALAGLLVILGIPGRSGEPRSATVGMLAGLRSAALLRPSVVFSATAMAAGVVVTFLPLAVTRASGGLAALALLAQATVTTLARWWAGRYADRRNPARLLIPGLLAAAAGVLALVLVDRPVAVLAGMMVFGVGFGVSQNASMTLMFNRVPPAGYGTASALWNLAYDAGMGLGAAGFGVLAAQTGYPAAFALTAAVMVVALGPAWRDRSRLAYVD
jgi:predicted MFS family arabinose efflux permease